MATLRRPEVVVEYKEKYPPSQLFITRLDVSDNIRIIEVFEEVKEHFGRFDVVVNNAGYGIEGEIEVTPDSEARKLFEVLFWSVVNVSKEALVFMRDINPPGLGGRILNISSMVGYFANPVFGLYSAAKFAVEGFTESLNKEMLPEWNIKAIIIEPGRFKTEWWTSSMVTLPIPHQYADPDTPSSFIRGMLRSDQSAILPKPLKSCCSLRRNRTHLSGYSLVQTVSQSSVRKRRGPLWRSISGKNWATRPISNGFQRRPSWKSSLISLARCSKLYLLFVICLGITRRAS